MKSEIISISKKTKMKETHLSYLILKHTHNSCYSFIKIFNSIRKRRNARGASSHEEQDLLRAMLLFASAGLDSMIKQLIRDTIHLIIVRDIGAQKEFEKFVTKELKNKSVEGNVDIKTLASLIVEESPKKALIKRLINYLTSNSLQSAEQLLKVGSFFGITTNDIYKDIDELKKVFSIRNSITHEMDIDFSQPNRNRFPRKKKDMIFYTNVILTVANNFINSVNKKLHIS